MTKKEFIDAVAEKTGFTKKASREATDAVFDVLFDVIVSGDLIRVAGLGTFTTVDIQAREGNNPHGGTIYVPEHKRPKFKPAGALRDACKNAVV